MEGGGGAWAVVYSSLRLPPPPWPHPSLPAPCFVSHVTDHFENLYAVVRGTKVFHLLPPSDVYRMALRYVRTATRLGSTCAHSSLRRLRARHHASHATCSLTGACRLVSVFCRRAIKSYHRTPASSCHHLCRCVKIPHPHTQEVPSRPIRGRAPLAP